MNLNFLLIRGRSSSSGTRRRRMGSDPDRFFDPVAPSSSPAAAAAPTTMATMPPTATSMPSPTPTPFYFHRQNDHDSPPRHTTLDGTYTILLLLFIIFCIIWSPALLRRCDPRHRRRQRRLIEARERNEEEGRRAAELALRLAMAEGGEGLGWGGGGGGGDYTYSGSDSNTAAIIGLGGLGMMTERKRREFLEDSLGTEVVAEGFGEQIGLDGDGDEDDSGEADDADSEVIAQDAKGSAPGTRPSSPTPSGPSTPTKATTSDTTKKKRMGLKFGPIPDEPICPICLIDYEAGDAISWSQNPKCHHCFHRGCILEWLTGHEECPCCRCDYLGLNADVEVEGACGEVGDGDGDGNGEADASRAPGDEVELWGVIPGPFASRAAALQADGNDSVRHPDHLSDGDDF